jgi:hypothetical protein
MKTIILCFTLTLSISSIASTKKCSKVYKKKYQKIKAYTLVKVYESKSLCGFHVTYNQNSEDGEISKGNSLHTQIIETKNTKMAIADSDFLKNKKFDLCEHSDPIENQLDCYINNDLFSIIAKKKNEIVSVSDTLDL